MVGTLINIWLTIEDSTGDRVLTDVSKTEPIAELLTSPKPEQRREIEQRTDLPNNIKDYRLDPTKRSALKRSMAR